MSIEHFDHVNTKNISGFHTSKNTAVEYLETTLGITFPLRPHLIEMDLRNRWMYIHKEGLLAGLRVLRGSLGTYSDEYSACFVKRPDDILTTMHESMHAYIFVINPTISRSRNEFNIKTKETKNVTLEEITKVFSYACFIEGICEWSAHEAALLAPEWFDMEKIQSERNRMLHGKRIPEQPEEDEKYISEILGLLDSSIEFYIAAIKSHDYRNFLSSQAIKRLNIARYFVGYRFVHLAINELRQRGFDINGALNLLILNPPVQLNELKQPQEYIKRITN